MYWCGVAGEAGVLYGQVWEVGGGGSYHKFKTCLITELHQPQIGTLYNDGEVVLVRVR